VVDIPDIITYTTLVTIG